MSFPLSTRPSRQCAVTLTDDDIDALDLICAATGDSRSALMRNLIRVGTALMLDPVTAVPAMLEGVEKHFTARTSPAGDEVDSTA